jgi:hypothetical protein
MNISSKALAACGQVGRFVVGTSVSVAAALDTTEVKALALLNEGVSTGALVVDKSTRPHQFRLVPEVADTLSLMDIIERTEELADCLLWTGATGKSGHPIYKPYGCPCTLTRRAVFRLTVGELVHREPIDTTCGEKLCLNPSHLVRSTVSKIGKRAAKTGAWSGLARRAKIAKTKRGQMKLTEEKAREIRESAESGPVLAERYGVNKSLVNNIKRGVAWRDYTPNPWAGLGARAGS